MNKKYLLDLHIHVGINERGQWVKIPSTRKLTVKNILKTAKEHKGLDAVGIIDAMSPLVHEDLSNLIDLGLLVENKYGGYLYEDKLLVLLGAEIETRELTGGLCHSLVFLPTLSLMKAFSHEMSYYIKNINLSSQNAHMTIERLLEIAKGYGAKFIPAHIFTPFKSLYGNATDRIKNIFSDSLPDFSAVELGLSADTFLANRISELNNYSYIVNSDAHSLQNIAREFTEIETSAELSYKSIFDAIERKNGHIKSLHGFDPKMGKYYNTRCYKCGKRQSYDDLKCSFCGGKVVKGVFERIEAISDVAISSKIGSNIKYEYHIPLLEIPGIGQKTIDKIYEQNFTELEVLYKLDFKDLSYLLGEKITSSIAKIRNKDFSVLSGGAGNYGQIVL